MLKGLSGALCAVSVAGSAWAASGIAIVSNERGNTLTVIGPDLAIVDTMETCARPRGMHFSADRSEFFVGCADDDQIAIYETATRTLLRRITGVPAPETFDLHPDGRRLVVSNEEDAAASVYDVETGELLAEYETGEEPEGVQITPDGRLAFVASEAANLVHVIDLEADAVIADILVDTRPRRFALTPDAAELWVSAELAGVVNIIDVASLKLVGDIAFLPTGFRPEQVTPVDVLITADGSRAYVALGRANHVAVVDVAAREVLDYVLVGKRAWGLALSADESRLFVANGLSDDVTVVDTASLRALTSTPTGLVPYGILIDDR
ncbi:PQQ-dependent catabolism-associated beta-propeller protein [Limibaculum sp. FT325]|uniref:PQQ-dependent catabolism-associated beta-propeller protein n=1 Tax=Thermohalobaculum sediminis TaxID=2939436 RepID=UPI0020BDC606|nr:PQQ-dependent catabolism-associated beta-propeller protein [Limibaculum sediminis]MCL5776894.1 PQQ-dependent catabolism-associated beta-propeller protein [Limibaculum sediminis]